MIAGIDHLIVKRRRAMFWVFILIAALAVAFVKLGMYAVWVSVLSGGLRIALMVIACLAIMLFWRRVFGKS